MRKLIPFAVLVAVLFCSGGCDFVRTVAGRPTSAEIAAMKAGIQTAARDTVVENVIIDSIGEIEEAGEVAVTDWSSHIKDAPPCSHYIMVGIFSNRDNALRQASYARNCGFVPTLIYFTNGRTGVGVCGGDCAESASHMQEVLSQPFCPEDAFILKTR